MTHVTTKNILIWRKNTKFRRTWFIISDLLIFKKLEGKLERFKYDDDEEIHVKFFLIVSKDLYAITNLFEILLLK